MNDRKRNLPMALAQGYKQPQQVEYDRQETAMLVNAQSITRRSALAVALIVGACTPVAASPATAAPLTPGMTHLVHAYGQLPLRFEANKGQVGGIGASSVRFLARGQGYGLYLTGTEAVLALRSTQDSCRTNVIRMQVLGANQDARAIGAAPLPGVSNYLLGDVPSRWHTNVPSYARVRLSAIYPGVDLVYYGNQQQLEYDFVVAAGADPNPIQLHFAGARQLHLDSQGNLVIVSDDGAIAFHKPVLYQTAAKHRIPVEGHFTLLANLSVGFTIGPYDHAKTLVIDPSLQYSTFLGGSNSDTISGIAIDASGNAYLTGSTLSADYPATPGVVQSTDTDSRSSAFITKLNASGTALIYSTFLGGSGSSSGGDSAQAIAVDASGNAYITGNTYSSDFPVTAGVYQASSKSAGGAPTGFVTKINTNGTKLLYSTYLGGTSTDNPTSIAVDPSGNAYLAGVTLSTNFPVTAGVLQSTNNSAPHGYQTAFLTKLNPTATALLYSTYLGGSKDYPATTPVRLAIDSSGDAYLAGAVGSTDFPVTKGAYQTTNKGTTGGGTNLTLSKINSTATSLLYSTYLGGSGAGYRGDIANGLAIDSSGNAYLAGITYETNFPTTTGALQTTNKSGGNGLSTGFVTKMNSTGTALVYSTYLGGSDNGYAGGLAVDSSGNVYVTGSTKATDFPITSNAYQTTNPASFNSGSVVFLSEFNPAGTSLLYSTYFGGANSFADSGYAIQVNSAGNVYLTGNTSASNFPITPGAYKSTYNSNNFTTGFVAEFSLGTAPTTLPTITTLTSNANPAPLGLKVTYTASVVPSTGTGIPTGNVVFSVDQATVATVALSSTGFATYSTSTLAYGAHAILASYQGSTKYSASGGNITESVTLRAPTFSPAAGIYPTAQLVTLSDSASGATIYYTLDGSIPSVKSTKYSAPLLVSTSQYIQAIALVSGAPISPVSSAVYSLITAPTVLAVPASALTTTKATLNALVNTNGMSGMYYFQYGTSSTALTSSTPKTALAMSPFGGSRLSFTPVTVSSTLTTLTSKTTYYYQVVTVTPAGTSTGAVLSFTTN